jgi:transposase
MSKRYEENFKITIVELYDSGQTVSSLCKEYELNSTTLYKWIDKYSKKGGQDYSKADFIALKKQLARVQEERDILKKVLAIFAEKKK